ncbi:hypothetical protein [Nitrososphaera sp.]|uniref:hypothetical protein n=1 Tax=Nitrososphaera sp. TaxID=1971748 RepID=UPI002ED9A458
MTRMRQPHSFHEVKVHNPETACSKCGVETPRVCEWCGACQACHSGQRAPERF